MITQEELKELVHYDFETGAFTHVTTKNGAWHKQCRKWCVRINNGTERLYLGLFDTLLDAAVARITAQRNLGYHPNHGEARPL